VEAVTLAQNSNEGVTAVARSLGVDVTTLRTWLHRAQQPSSDSEMLTASERKELAQLRREVSVLRMERDILKTPSRSASDLLNQKLLTCYQRFCPEGATVCFLVTLEPVKKPGSWDCCGFGIGDALGRSRLGN
jgi:transposase